MICISTSDLWGQEEGELWEGEPGVGEETSGSAGAAEEGAGEVGGAGEGGAGEEGHINNKWQENAPNISAGILSGCKTTL